MTPNMQVVLDAMGADALTVPQISERTGMGVGRLYAILYHLENQEYILSRWENAASVFPRRRIYYKKIV